MLDRREALEFLSPLGVDTSVASAMRSDARTVVALHDRRREALERRAALEAPAVTLLGMLLVAPAGGTRGL